MRPRTDGFEVSSVAYVGGGYPQSMVEALPLSSEARRSRPSEVAIFESTCPPRSERAAAHVPGRHDGCVVLNHDEAGAHAVCGRPGKAPLSRRADRPDYTLTPEITCAPRMYTLWPAPGRLDRQGVLCPKMRHECLSTPNPACAWSNFLPISRRRQPCQSRLILFDDPTDPDELPSAPEAYIESADNHMPALR